MIPKEKGTVNLFDRESESEDRERAEFETWANDNGLSLSSYRFPPGAPSKYVFDTECAWYVWQAARREEWKRTLREATTIVERERQLPSEEEFCERAVKALIAAIDQDR